MATLKRSDFVGKTKEQIVAMIVSRFNQGTLTQAEFDKANKAMANLNAGKVYTDEQMLSAVFRDLGI